MERTIIYVLGPKRFEKDYRSNIALNIEFGGWLKIGLTTKDTSEDKWDVAKSRCNQESRTGLCETCKIFDVFEYPKLGGKPDDEIRRILSDEIYELNTSRKNNSLVDDTQYEVKAGREFVYGASRKHIISAVAKFERNIILDFFDKKKDLQELVDMIRKNNSDIADEVDENAPTDSTKEQTEQIDAFFEKIKNGLSSEIKDACVHSPGRRYMCIKSKAKAQFQYFVKYSSKFGTTSVAVETINQTNRDNIEKFIENNAIRNKIPTLSATSQGIKNKDKYFWEVTGDYSGVEDVVIKWFIDSITIMHEEFEKYCEIQD